MNHALNPPTEILRFSWERGASEIQSTGPQNIPRVEQIAGLLEVVHLSINLHGWLKEVADGIKFLGQKC